MSVLYALIYCSVLARRSRRHKQKTASLAAMNSTLRPATVFDLQQDNCEEMTMTALKVPNDIEARKIRATSLALSKVFYLCVVDRAYAILIWNAEIGIRCEMRKMRKSSNAATMTVDDMKPGRMNLKQKWHQFRPSKLRDASL